MANQESFIDEVNDEVRRDRLFALMRRYGWIAILFVLLLVGGAAFNEYRKASARAEAEARGDAILAALNLETPSARREALAAIDTGGDADTGALVGLMAAGASPDTPEAMAADLLDLAARPGISSAFRDLALLKSVMVAGDALAADDRIARLDPLTLPGAPFRLLALEQVALAQVDQGERETAIAGFTEILNDNATSEGLRRRAAQMIVALGGTPDGS